MKRFGLALAFCASLIAFVGYSAFGQSPEPSYQVAQGGMGPGPGTVHSTGGGSPTFTPGSSVAMIDNAFSSGTKTFSGMNGGVNYPSGAVVIVGFFNRDGTPATTPLIGGQTASVVSGAVDSSNKCTLYQATMPSAQNDTFSIANGSDYSGIGAAGGYFTNLASSARDAVGTADFGSDNNTINMTSSPTVTSPGFGVAFVGSSINNTDLPTAATWASTTSGSGDTFANLFSVGTPYSASITLAHTATAGAWSPTAQAVTFGWDFVACMVGATYH